MMSTAKYCPGFLTDPKGSLFEWLYYYGYEYNLHSHFSSPTCTQNFKDPLLDFRDNLAFGVEARDKVPKISQSTEVNTKGVGAG